MLTDLAVLDLLKRGAKKERSLSAYAETLGVPQQTLWAVLNGTRTNIPDGILKALKLRRVYLPLGKSR